MTAADTSQDLLKLSSSAGQALGRHAMGLYRHYQKWIRQHAEKSGGSKSGQRRPDPPAA